MNFYEAQDFFKNMYPNNLVIFEFDDFCHRVHEITYTDGKPDEMHHIECNKVKVTVQGMDINPIYVPIKAHRLICCLKDIKEFLNKYTDFINKN